MLARAALRSLSRSTSLTADLSAARSLGVPGARLYSRRSRLLSEEGHQGWYGGERLKATTILSVRKNNQVFLIGDGQVTLGSQVIKPNARKVRKLKEGVICGFAGATADAMTLFERLEMKLQVRQQPLDARTRAAAVTVSVCLPRDPPILAGASRDHACVRRDGQSVADGQVPPPARSHHDCRGRQCLLDSDRCATMAARHAWRGARPR